MKILTENELDIAKFRQLLNNPYSEL